MTLVHLVRLAWGELRGADDASRGARVRRRLAEAGHVVEAASGPSEPATGDAAAMLAVIRQPARGLEPPRLVFVRRGADGAIWLLEA